MVEDANRKKMIVPIWLRGARANLPHFEILHKFVSKAETNKLSHFATTTILAAGGAKTSDSLLHNLQKFLNMPFPAVVEHLTGVMDGSAISRVEAWLMGSGRRRHCQRQMPRRKHPAGGLPHRPGSVAGDRLAAITGNTLEDTRTMVKDCLKATELAGVMPFETTNLPWQVAAAGVEEREARYEEVPRREGRGTSRRGTYLLLEKEVSGGRISDLDFS